MFAILAWPLPARLQQLPHFSYDQLNNKSMIHPGQKTTNKSLNLNHFRRQIPTLVLPPISFLPCLRIVAVDAFAKWGASPAAFEAVTVFFQAVGLAAVARDARLRYWPSLATESIRILSYNLVDGLAPIQALRVVFAALTKAGLSFWLSTWSHTRPTAKHMQYIFKHWLLEQLQPVYLLGFPWFSSRMRWLCAVGVWKSSSPGLEHFFGVQRIGLASGWCESLNIKTKLN